MAPDKTSEATRLCEEANDLLRAGKADEAIRRLNFALDSLRAKRDPRTEARVLEQFACAHRFTGDMEQAEQSTRAALACWMKVEDPAEEARVLGLLASLRISQGALQDGEFWLKSSLRVLIESGDRAGEADILRSLGALYLRKGELAQAEEHAREAINLFSEIDDKVGEARTLGTYAQILMRRSAFSEAHAAAERCQELFAELGHKQGVTSGMQVRAAIMRREGRLVDAEKLLCDMIEQKREMKDIAGEAGAMNTLGLVVFHSGGRLNEAERHFLRSIELFGSVNDTQNAARAQQNLADLYHTRGRAADAEVVLRDVLEVHRHASGLESQARTLGAIARVLSAQGKLDESLQAFEESIDLARQVNDHGLLVRMLCPWAELSLLLGEIGDAWSSLKVAIAHARPERDVMLRHVLPLSVRVAIVEEDYSTAEALLNEARLALEQEPASLRPSLGDPIESARNALEAAQSGRPLYWGFLPETIDAGLRHALLKRLKEVDPKAYGSLDASIVKAMEA